MVSLVGIIIWMFVVYKLAKQMKEKEGLNVDPWTYATLSVLFGFIFSMSVLVEKYARIKNKVGLRVGAIVVMVSVIIFNLLYIFL